MTIEQDRGPRRRFVFSLDENIPGEDDFDGPGPWQTGFRIAVNDTPMDQPGDNQFLLANSLTRQIYGPFVQIRPVYYDAEGIIFARKEAGTPQTNPEICHYILEFAKAEPEHSLRRSMSWPKVAKLIGVPEVNWSKLRQLEITDDQFGLICAVLSRLNENREGPPITVEEAIAELEWESGDFY